MVTDRHLNKHSKKRILRHILEEIPSELEERN
jgi:hypothetical protein